MKWIPEIRPCPVCDSELFKVLGQRGGRAHRDNLGIEATVVRCKNCMATYAHPMLIPDSNPYAEDTVDNYFANHDSTGKIEMGRIQADHSERILGRKGKILEVGCGRGENLLGVVERGWEGFGVEMTEEFAFVAKSKGIQVEVSSAEESKLLSKENTYDVVILAAILEHLYEPQRILKKIHSALKSDGLVFIDVPNEAALSLAIGNLYMKLKGKDWAINLSPTFPPFHVVGFTPKSLKHILEKTGFEILEMRIQKYSNTLPRGSSLLRKLEYSAMNIVQSIGARVDRGDGIACWARKFRR